MCMKRSDYFSHSPDIKHVKKTEVTNYNNSSRNFLSQLQLCFWQTVGPVKFVMSCVWGNLKPLRNVE